MANAGDPVADRDAGPGFVAFTILGLIGLVAVVALLVQSYDTSSDVAAVDAALASAPAPSDPVNPQVAPPVAPLGGVATGGGGTADASTNLVLVSGVVATITLLAGAGMALRHRLA